MSNNSKLEGKLRAIQDLKAEHYIGTQQAWQYLKELTNIYELPKKIVGSINNEVSKRTNLIYPATLENLLGLYHALETIIIKASKTELDELIDSGISEYSKEFENSEHNRVENVRRLKKNPVINLPDFIQDIKFIVAYHNGQPIIPYYRPQQVIDYLVPIFENAQYPTTNNNSFGLEASLEILKDYPLTTQERKVISFLLPQLDWNLVFSKESIRKAENGMRENAFYEKISIHDRIQRMIRDQVDHKLENRREILADYLSLFTDTDTSYEEIAHLQRELLKERRKRYQELVSMEIAPELMIEETKRMIEVDKFILITLADKNFAIKFLKN